LQCGGIIGDRTGAAHYKRLLLRRRKRKRRTRTRRRVGNNIKDVSCAATLAIASICHVA